MDWLGRPKTLPRRVTKPRKSQIPVELPAEPKEKSQMTYTEFLELHKVPQKNPNRLLVPQFPNPVSDVKNFAKILNAQKFVLESVTVSDPSDNFLRLSGIVRTLNLGPNVQVKVRYSLNKFSLNKNFKDVIATQVEAPFIFSKRYSFTIYLNSMDVGDHLQMFLLLKMPNRYRLWDTAEDGDFYKIDCLDAMNLPKKFITFLPI